MRSFTGAAGELGVTQAAVSRQIKNLEQELSVRLLDRGSSRSTLTDAGEMLFRSVHNAFKLIDQAVERITGSGEREILNVSVAPYFSACWLTPRIMSFFRKYPDIDLRLHHSYDPADHKREGIDIGINWGSGAWHGVEKERVLDGSLTVVLAPALGRRVDVGKGPAQLSKLLLLYEFDLNHWRSWFEAAGAAMAPEAESLRLSDSHALRRAVLDGHGAALFFSELVRDDLESGSLIAPFAIKIHTGHDYFLNYEKDIELPRKSRIFRRWMFDELAQQAGNGSTLAI
jgi:DNA-binding transcriptional LysR family regulator